jgi:hypothetical protein
VVSPGDWLVNSIWFLLSTVFSCNWEVMCICHFVQGGQNCCCFHQVAAALLFRCNCLVNFSPSKVVQCNFSCCPLSDEISYGIHHLPHFGRLACHPTPALSLCASPNICLVLVCLLWEVGLSPCHPLMLEQHLFTESSALRVCLLDPPPFSRAGSAFHPSPLLSVLDYNLLFMLFSFVGGVQSSQGLHWIMSQGWVGESHVLCDTHLLFCRFMQASLELANGEKWCCFSQCSMV